MPFGDQMLMIDQVFFSTLFQLLSKILTNFTLVLKEVVEEMMIKFFASEEPLNTFGKKKNIKMKIQLPADVVAKIILDKAGSFDAFTNNKFLVMAAIVGGFKVNWSSILFLNPKAMISL